MKLGTEDKKKTALAIGLSIVALGTLYVNVFSGGGSTPSAPRPASAQTLLSDDPGAAGQAAVLCRVDRAEALWLAGGNQWDYLGGWPTALHDGIQRLHARGGAVGGCRFSAAPGWRPSAAC